MPENMGHPDQRNGFAAVLRTHRLSAGLTQEALAERAGLSTRGLQHLEAGETRPYRATAEALAGALGLRGPERARFAAAASPAPRRRGRVDRGAQRAGLPAALTSFIGRTCELAEVEQLLERARLLTLVGPGGSGKTRLALEAAARADGAFADGVCFVDLTPLRDSALVLPAIARALGASDEGGAALDSALARTLREKELLVVLDNCEHVLEGVHPVAALLRACPHLRVLATSRAALRLSGEQEYAVGPLRVPGAGARLAAGTLLEYEAVRLFVERARAVVPEFALTEHNAAAVVQICRRLDGLPLAIELAAPRLKVLPPAALLAQLGSALRAPDAPDAPRALPLLTTGARDAPERHQTLRGAIDWSYGLLDPRGQGCHRRLAVFAGGCTLEAVRWVWDVDGAECLDRLGALVDSSLAERRVGVDGAPRFHLLETIREHAAERLIAGGELESARSRHAEHYLALAEREGPGVRGPGQRASLARLEEEHGNLRVALAWLTERGDTPRGLRLATAIHYFWYVRGYAGEGRAWLERLLAQPGAADGTALRARALEADGLLAVWQADYATGRARLEESLALAHRVGDDRVALRARVHLVQLFFGAGDHATARVHALECLARGERVADAWVVCQALLWLGGLALAEGDYLGARPYVERSLILRREAGLVVGAGASVRLLGVIATHLGEHDRARALLADSLAAARQLGHTVGIWGGLVGWAGLAATEGRPDRAARLFGAAATVRAATGIGSPLTDPQVERDVAATRAVLGDEAYEVASAEGARMDLEEAIAYALDDAPAA